MSKVAVSLPVALLTRVEEARSIDGKSRSEFIAAAVTSYLDERAAEREQDAYAHGYRAFPETREEIEAADRLAGSILAAEPWE